MTDQEKVVCPRDLRELPWDELPLCDIEGRPHQGPDGELLSVEAFRAMPREDLVEVYRNEVYRRCPNPTCGMLLPWDYAEDDRMVLGVVGAAASSKSTYLGALVHLLHDEVALSGMGIDVVPLVVAEHKNFHREFIRPPFLDQRAVELTQRGQARGPYCYRLHNRVNGRRLNLVILDSAGDDLTDNRGRYNAAYIAEADGLIILLDPTQMPKVAERVFPPSEQVTDPYPEPQRLLIKGLAEPLRGLRVPTFEGSDLFQTPTAVALAKADLIRHQAHNGAKRFLAQDQAPSALDLDEVEQENQAMISFLYENEEAVIANDVMRNFFDFSFHFVTATNMSAEKVGDQLVYPSKPEPKRVLQPLLVILHRRGFLDHTQVTGGLQW